MSGIKVEAPRILSEPSSSANTTQSSIKGGQDNGGTDSSGGAPTGGTS